MDADGGTAAADIEAGLSDVRLSSAPTATPTSAGGVELVNPVLSDSKEAGVDTSTPLGRAADGSKTTAPGVDRDGGPAADAVSHDAGAGAREPSIWHEMSAEAIGTFIICLFGTGSVSAAVLTGAQAGLWQVAVVWGFGVSLAIYTTADISGAHLNPAISCAFALVRPGDFPRRKLLPFIAAQIVGGILGGCINLLSFHSMIDKFEATHNITRGEPGSQLSAMVFGEYFPNPAMFGTDQGAFDLMSPIGAMFIEGWGTAVLAFVIFALTHSGTRVLGPYRQMVPFFIGFTVASLISLYAPLTQAGWNPARDFGPRVVAAMAGWGTVAIPGPRSGFWVYIVGPCLGAPLGALFHDKVLAPALLARQQTGSKRQ